MKAAAVCRENRLNAFTVNLSFQMIMKSIYILACIFAREADRLRRSPRLGGLKTIKKGLAVEVFGVSLYA